MMTTIVTDRDTEVAVETTEDGIEVTMIHKNDETGSTEASCGIVLTVEDADRLRDALTIAIEEQQRSGA